MFLRHSLEERGEDFGALRQEPWHRLLQERNKPRIIEWRQAQDEEARGERLIEFPRTRIALIHRREEACGRMHRQRTVAGDLEQAPVIEQRMQHGERFVACHIHLIEHAESALHRAFVDRARTEPHLACAERIRPDERCGIRIDVQRDVEDRPAERRREILRQNILPRRLRADQQQMLSRQQGCDGRLEDLPAVVAIGWLRQPPLPFPRIPLPPRGEIAPQSFAEQAAHLLVHFLALLFVFSLMYSRRNCRILSPLQAKTATAQTALSAAP